MAGVFDSILDTVGNTPIVQMRRVGFGLQGKIFLKLEFFNPLGSVKDRIAVAMIEAAERMGRLRPRMRVLEPTSGNTGIGLAFVCAAKGYPLTLVMPETMSQERRVLLLMLGAEVVLTPGPLGMKGAIAKAEEMVKGRSDIFVPAQFDNPANPEVHRRQTAIEIWTAMEGRVDYVVAGVGTGGTVTGVGEVLKEKNPRIQVVAVEPEESSVIAGKPPGPHKIQGIGAGFIPRNLNRSFVDETISISSQRAIDTARKVIREEGIPIGISSGAAIAAALDVAARPAARQKQIVVIAASSLERYLSTALAEEARNTASSLPVSQVDPAYLL